MDKHQIVNAVVAAGREAAALILHARAILAECKSGHRDVIIAYDRRVQARLAQQVVTLEPGNAFELSRLFNLPDEKLVSVELPPEANGILEAYTDAEGRRMLRALATCAEAIPVTSDYTVGSNAAVSRFTARVQVASGAVGARLPVPETGKRLAAVLRGGQDIPAAKLFGLPDAQLITIELPAEADGFLETYTDAEGRQMLRPLAPSEQLLEVMGEYYVDSTSEVTHFTELLQIVPVDLSIRYSGHSLDEFTLPVGEEPIELYACDGAGQRVSAYWSADNEDAQALSALL